MHRRLLTCGDALMRMVAVPDFFFTVYSSNPDSIFNKKTLSALSFAQAAREFSPHTEPHPQKSILPQKHNFPISPESDINS